MAEEKHYLPVERQNHVPKSRLLRPLQEREMKEGLFDSEMVLRLTSRYLAGLRLMGATRADQNSAGSTRGIDLL